MCTDGSSVVVQYKFKSDGVFTVPTILLYPAAVAAIFSID